MSRRDKLIAKMRRTPGKIRFEEIEALLRFEGFDLIGNRGSHAIYRRGAGMPVGVVRPHGNRTTCHPRDIRRILEAIENVEDVS